MRRNRILQLAILALVLAAGCAARQEPKTGVCGGIRGLQCPQANQFCELPAGQCKSADLEGVCTERPEACTKEYSAVCGCDGKTYGNDCERKRAGVQRNHAGECTAG